MNHYTKGYSKKLGDTLRENEALTSKVAALELACTYEVMSLACARHYDYSYEISFEQCVLASLKEINTPGGK